MTFLVMEFQGFLVKKIVRFILPKAWSIYENIIFQSAVTKTIYSFPPVFLVILRTKTNKLILKKLKSLNEIGQGFFLHYKVSKPVILFYK